ncbi:MAG: hypothetical protein KDE35_14760 [Geminicoccaceae bacterium]|nr:hypothetical protein [Geminicoccaceae bacterium]
MHISVRLALVSLGVALTALPVAADMRVELVDGRVLNLAVEEAQIERLVLDGRVIELGPRADAPGDKDETATTPAEPETLFTSPIVDERGRRVLHVGPKRRYKRPSDAARAAEDGDIVEIDAGTYRGDVAGWPQSDLVIRAKGGRVVLDAQGKGHAGKGIWVVSGRNVIIEGIDFSRCKVADHNCAAIRAEGADLTLRGIHSHHNEMGLLVAEDFEGQVLIEQSQFNDNGTDHDRFGIQPGHNIYVSGGDKLVLVASWLHDPIGGHNVKSRAPETLILYNRIEDGDHGNGSYQIDVSEGGRAVVLGNLIGQGPRAENSNIVAFAPETGGADNGRLHELKVVHNTIVNTRHWGTFVHNFSNVPAIVRNNLFVGRGDVVEGEAIEVGNVRTNGPAENDPAALDAGVAGKDVPAADITASYVYEHPMKLRARRTLGKAPDAGAYEATVE